MLIAAVLVWRALALRLWGSARPAVRLQRRRERALRAAGDRDVRALLQPGLLRQPARLHVPAARRVRGCAWRPRRRSATRSRPTRRPCSRSRALVVGAARRARPSALLIAAGRRLFGRRRRPGRGRAAGRRLPAGPLRAPGAQRRAGARAAVPGAGRRRRASTATGGCATSRSPAPALGLACATKYTAGIVAACLLVAAALGDAASAGPRCAGWRSRARSRWRRFVVANPYALLDFDAFRDGPAAAVRGLGRRRRQARPHGATAGSVYYLGTLTWGLGWLPALAAARRRDRARRARPAAGARARARAACCSCSSWAPRTASSPAGCCRSTRCCACWRRGRSWPRRAWLAPRRAAARRWPASPRRAAVRAGARLLGPQRPSCSPAPTRASSRATGWSPTSRGLEGRGRADRARPVGDRRPARREGTGTGNRWIKWPTSRAPDAAGRRRDQARGLRAHAPPGAVGAYARGGYCWVVTGSTQYGRAYAEPRAGAEGDRATTRRSSARDVVYEVEPRRRRQRPAAVLLRLLVQLLPASLRADRARRSGSTACGGR